MKVQNNANYMGGDSHKATNTGTKNADATNRHSINGSALNGIIDPIAAKRESAKKEAMKIVGDVFANTQKVDNDLQARAEHVKSLHKDLGEANRAIKDIEDDRAALRDSFGVKEDSEEEQNLKLLEKEAKSRMPGSKVTLTFEETKKINEIKANGLSEYQERSLDMLNSETPYVVTANEAERDIKIENQIISATELERLKSHPMVDAKNQAEAIMDEASKEIVGMLMDEAKDHVDGEMEKAEEKAKAKKEKAEELQERIDAAKEKKHEEEELTENILEGAAEVSANATDMNAAKQEINDMMSKMKLLEEDIKGAAVDKSI